MINSFACPFSMGIINFELTSPVRQVRNYWSFFVR
jgi:hypothetical protein